MKKGLVMTGGSKPSQALLDREIEWADAIICADSGFDMLGGNTEKLDLVIGDFDSTRRTDMLDRLNVPIEALSPQKDETDTEMAMLRMLEKNPSQIHILGATGSRLDHSLATVLSLESYLDRDVEITLIDDHNELRIVDSGRYVVHDSGFKYFSLIPLTDSIEVSTKGMAYEIDHAILYRKKTRGVSNEIVDEEATVYIHEGRAMMIKSKDA
ncbi:MAG: thiamine diphosphokinase [Peptoniphilus sp.]|nr:thiamine diphosphokinase [Peptoniphilus sp.]MDD7362950.1 thiamine diphosphokinase [Bacillota bacterium]MDY6044190.1 thiamine diphosphokinase [Peptoniphilus sp.]